jgi:hypothetical protein
MSCLFEPFETGCHQPLISGGALDLLCPRSLVHHGFTYSISRHIRLAHTGFPHHLNHSQCSTVLLVSTADAILKFAGAVHGVFTRGATAPGSGCAEIGRHQVCTSGSNEGGEPQKLARQLRTRYHPDPPLLHVCNNPTASTSRTFLFAERPMLAAGRDKALPSSGSHIHGTGGF